ncbi:MAG: ATP-binding cassette domain-containing protein [Bacteroidota bacterium]
MDSAPARPIARLSDVSMAYGQRTLLDKVNLALPRGAFSYLVGQTGVGKSTVLRMLYGDAIPDSGTIEVDEFVVTNLSRNEIPFLRRKLGIIFQDYQLLPDRNVSDNIAFALKATGWKNNTALKRRISEVLIRVGMAGKTNAMPHQLSGGEQQRVVIARALINDPVLLVADEPTGNLDPEVSHHIMLLLKEINLNGTTILMATHEYSLLQQFPARVLELRDTQLKEYPTSEAFLLDYGQRLSLG